MPEAAVPVHRPESLYLHPILSVDNDDFHPNSLGAFHGVGVPDACRLDQLPASAPSNILLSDLLPAAADGGCVRN